MKEYYDVYGLGSALMDIEFEISDATLLRLNIHKGVHTLIDEEREKQLLEDLDGIKHVKACGGSAANTLMTLQLLGGSGFFSSKVANDSMGKIYYNDLTRSGLDSNLHTIQHDGSTGKCIVMITPDAERTLNTLLGVNDYLSCAELNPDIVPRSQYVYLEGYLASPPINRLEAAIHLRKLAQQHGKKVALSLSDPHLIRQFRKEMLELIGEKVDLIFCNEHEARTLTQTQDLEQASKSLLQYTQHVLITCGARGVMGYDGQRWFELPSYPVHAIDGVGAGDVFAGAFLYAVTHGFNFATAADIGCFAASRVVTKYGPRLDTIHLHQIKEHMQRQFLLTVTVPQPH